MQKNPYFPSPLRRDYVTKPLRNFIPILSSQQNPNQNNQEYSLSNNYSASNINGNQNARKKNQIDDLLPQSRIIRYQDGILIPIIRTPNLQTGIFLTRNYTCIIYNIQENLLQSKTYIFYPTGIIACINYQKNKIKQLTIIELNKFIGHYQYKLGHQEGEQYYYNYQDKMLISSVYRRGRLLEIKNGLIGDIEHLISNQHIRTTINQLQQCKLSINKKFPCIKTDNFLYYGELDPKKQTPHGYGILLTTKNKTNSQSNNSEKSLTKNKNTASQRLMSNRNTFIKPVKVLNQLYIGNFNRGFLNGLSCMKFEDDSYYFGQLTNGVCEGYGCITHLKNNKPKKKNKAKSENQNPQVIYKFNNQKIDKKQFDMYVKLQMLPQSVNPSPITITNSSAPQQRNAKWLQKYKFRFEDIEKYHEQFKSKFRQDHQGQNKKEKNKSKSKNMYLHMDNQRGSQQNQGQQEGQEDEDNQNDEQNRQRDPSSINIQLQQSASKQSYSDISIPKNSYGNSKKPDKNIPILSLFKQMDNKNRNIDDQEQQYDQDNYQQKYENKQDRDKDREKDLQQHQFQQNTQRKKTQTQRNSRDSPDFRYGKKNPTITIKVPKEQNSQILNADKNKTNRSFNPEVTNFQRSGKKQKGEKNDRYEHLETVDLNKNKWYVAPQQNIIKQVHEFNTKPNIQRNPNPSTTNKFTKMSFKRSQYNTDINMGKILNVGSDVSQHQDIELIKKLATPEKNPISIVNINQHLDDVKSHTNTDVNTNAKSNAKSNARTNASTRKSNIAKIFKTANANKSPIRNR